MKSSSIFVCFVVLLDCTFASKFPSKQSHNIKDEIIKKAGGVDIRGQRLNLSWLSDSWLEDLMNLSGVALKRILLEENLEVLFSKFTGHQNDMETRTGLIDYLRQLMDPMNLFDKPVAEYLSYDVQKNIRDLFTLDDILQCITKEALEEKDATILTALNSKPTLSNLQTMLVDKYLEPAIEILSQMPSFAGLKTENNKRKKILNFEDLCEAIENAYHDYEKFNQYKEELAKHPFFTTERIMSIVENKMIGAPMRAFIRSHQRELPLYVVVFGMQLPGDEIIKSTMKNINYSLDETLETWINFFEDIFQSLKKENLEMLKKHISTIVERKKIGNWELQGNTLEEAVSDYIKFRCNGNLFLEEATTIEEFQTLMSLREHANQYPNMASSVKKIFSFGNHVNYWRYQNNIVLGKGLALHNLQLAVAEKVRKLELKSPYLDLMIDFIFESVELACVFLESNIWEDEFPKSWDFVDKFLNILNEKNLLLKFYSEFAKSLGYDITHREFPLNDILCHEKIISWIQEPLFSKINGDLREQKFLKEALTGQSELVKTLFDMNPEKVDCGVVGRAILLIIDKFIASDKRGIALDEFNDFFAKNDPNRELETILSKYRENPTLLTSLLFAHLEPSLNNLNSYRYGFYNALEKIFEENNLHGKQDALN